VYRGYRHEGRRRALLHLLPAEPPVQLRELAREAHRRHLGEPSLRRAGGGDGRDRGAYPFEGRL